MSNTIIVIPVSQNNTLIRPVQQNGVVVTPTIVSALYRLRLEANDAVSNVSLLTGNTVVDTIQFVGDGSTNVSSNSSAIIISSSATSSINNIPGSANTANQLSQARTIDISGDIAGSNSFDGSQNITISVTLSNTGVITNTYGNTTHYSTFTVDSKGRVTSANTQPLPTFDGNLYLLKSDLASNVLSLTANNSTFSYGKTEDALNVNSAATSLIANNANNLNGKAESALNVNTATTALTSNNATNLGGVAAANYQTTAGLSANVARLTANNANNLNGKAETALNVNSATTSLTSNNATNLGGVAAANYQTTAGLTANVATLTANNSTFSYGKAEGALNVNSASTALTSNNSTNLNGKSENALNVNNATTSTTSLTANNATNLGGVAAASYQTTAGLSANVARLTANNANNLNGKAETALNVNSATTSITANNSTFSYGKTEDALNVNSATTSLTSNNSTNLNGKVEGDLNVNSAATSLTSNNAANLNGKAETALNVNSAVTSLTANNSTNLGGVAAASYQTTAGLSANVARLTANNSNNLNGKAEVNLNVNNAVTANTLTTARTITLSGDVTSTNTFNGSGNVTFNTLLVNTAVTPAAYGNSTYYPTFTVDSKGRIVTASSVLVPASGGGSGQTYTISALSASGGANVRLTSSDSTNDDITFVGTGSVTVTQSGDTITIDGAAGAAAAGGSNTEIQFNNSTVLTGSPGLTFNTTSNTITVANSAVIGNSTLYVEIANSRIEMGSRGADAPSTPPANSLIFFARNAGGRQMPAFVGPSGVDSLLQPTFARNRIAMVFPNPSAATLTTFGIVMGNTLALSTRVPAATNLFTSLRRGGIASNTTAGTSAGLRGNGVHYWRGNAPGLGGFHFIARFGVAIVAADMRAFVGWKNVTGAMSNANPSAQTNIIGVGFDSTQTTWRIMTNGNSGTAPTIDLGAGFPTNVGNTNMLELAMFHAPNGTELEYQFTNITTSNTVYGSVSANSTNMPNNVTFLSPHFWINNGSTAGVAALDIVSLYIETDL